MKKNYFKHAALAMGIVAVAGTANADWQNVNGLYMTNASYVPGWNGALTATADGVAETYDGAFEIYQVINDAKPGKYTLTVTAFYRFGGTDYSYENTKDGANHNAYVFIGDQKTPVKTQFDETLSADDVTVMQNAIAEGQEWMIATGDYGTVPNGTVTANALFAAGKYLNTVTVNHEGGDLVFGIGNVGGRQDEWTCFDNFKLTGPDGDVTIANGDFAQTLDTNNGWDNSNVKNEAKTPDVNKSGGVYRKTNASPYNFGTVVDLPAGKYRFGVQSFLRYGGAGNVTGKYVTCKGAWGWVEDESALDRYNAGSEDETHHAYVYATNAYFENEGKPLKPTSAAIATTLVPTSFYKETKIKNIFDEKLDVYPDNEPSTDGATEEGYGWCDSGFEYQAAACFINNPDLYRNYVEFELTEPAKVWVGLKKDLAEPTQYWSPFRDYTLERYVASEGSAVSEVEVADENAPVEYYNLQGIRVANPENGLYIVKQGKKVTKQIFK